MILKALIVLVVLAAIFIVIVALRPSDFRVTRSASISAPPALAFEQVNDIRKWQEVSPYAKLDPNAKNTFEGPPAGVGAALAWSGNKHIGEGRMTIEESRANELVQMKLEFVRPFTSTSTAEFTFTPEGDDTVVTWSLIGRSAFMCKAISMFISMDKMCGAQFEEGLASIKAVAERRQPILQAAR
jgi:hypothetical protein